MLTGQLCQIGSVQNRTGDLHLIRSNRSRKPHIIVPWVKNAGSLTCRQTIVAQHVPYSLEKNDAPISPATEHHRKACVTIWDCCSTNGYLAKFAVRKEVWTGQAGQGTGHPPGYGIFPQNFWCHQQVLFPEACTTLRSLNMSYELASW